MRNKRYWIPALLLCLLGALGSTQVTLFVLQPIGAVPEGRTLVILRRQRTQFIDSADAICEREMGGVSLLCRAGVLGAIAGDSGEVERAFRREAERHSGMIPNTVRA